MLQRIDLSQRPPGGFKKRAADTASQEIFTQRFLASNFRHLINYGICWDACTVVKDKLTSLLIPSSHKKSKASVLLGRRLDVYDYIITCQNIPIFRLNRFLPTTCNNSEFHKIAKKMSNGLEICNIIAYIPTQFYKSASEEKNFLNDESSSRGNSCFLLHFTNTKKLLSSSLQMLKKTSNGQQGTINKQCFTIHLLHSLQVIQSRRTFCQLNEAPKYRFHAI